MQACSKTAKQPVQFVFPIFVIDDSVGKLCENTPWIFRIIFMYI